MQKNSQENNTTPKNQEVWVWYGVGSLFKQSWATYEGMPYERVPEVTIAEQFKDIKTIYDLEKNLHVMPNEIKSPTACYFDIDKKSQIFYCDQQGCILWALDSQNRVYIHNGDDGENGENDNEDKETKDEQKGEQKGEPKKVYYVAKSLPEFLTRIKLEGDMWYKKHSSTYTGSRELTKDEKEYEERFMELNRVQDD